MRRWVYDASMTAGATMIIVGVALLAGLATALVVAGSLIMIMTVFARVFA